MRDQMKVIIGLGSIWGLFALGLTLISSFTFGSNDTAPEIAAIALYGLTILPASILSIWYRKIAAFWLIALSPIAAFGFLYQIVMQVAVTKSAALSIGNLTGLLLIAAVPGFLGICMFRTRPLRTFKNNSSPKVGEPN
jgi:hypothetical protein